MTPARPRNCQAQRQANEMRCARCGLLWDLNDPEPPACPRQAQTECCTHNCNQGRGCPRRTK